MSVPSAKGAGNVTALMAEEYRDPGDCPYRWGHGYDPCLYHDLPVHKCLIQAGHDHPCLCMCGVVPPLAFPRPQRFRWTGYLDECLHPWRVADSVPCVESNPTRSHMCVDGDDQLDLGLGEYGHNRNYHTCRCGERTHTEHGARRARRDLERS